MKSLGIKCKVWRQRINTKLRALFPSHSSLNLFSFSYARVKQFVFCFAVQRTHFGFYLSSCEYFEMDWSNICWDENEKKENGDASHEIILTIANCPKRGLCPRKWIHFSSNHFHIIWINECKTYPTSVTDCCHLKPFPPKKCFVGIWDTPTNMFHKCWF